MKLRFLLFVLMAATVPLVVALMVTAKTVHVTQAGFENRITSALTMLESRMEAEGAKRRELLLRLSDPQSLIGSALLADAGRGQPPTLDLARQLRVAISDLTSETDVPEVVAVATPQGVALSVTDHEIRKVDVESMPLAKSALDGHRAELWALLDGALYRFFSVPIGIAEGAFIIGDRVGEATAARFREATRADVTFVIGDVAQVSSIPILERDEVVVAAQRPNSTVRTGRLTLGLIGFEFLDEIFPLFAPGEAMISLGRTLGNQVSVVVTMRTEQEAGWVGWVQLFSIALAAGTVLVGLLWSWLLVLPVNRQARSIERHLARLRVERGAQLTTRGFSAPFTTLVQTLDKLAEHHARELTSRKAQPPPQPANLEETPEPDPDQIVTARHLLRPPEELPLADSPSAIDGDEDEGTPAAFPFGDDPALQQALADASASLAKRTATGDSSAIDDEELATKSSDAPVDGDDPGATPDREWPPRPSTPVERTPTPTQYGAQGLGMGKPGAAAASGYGGLTTAASGTGSFGPEDDESQASTGSGAFGDSGSPQPQFGNAGSAALKAQSHEAPTPKPASTLPQNPVYKFSNEGPVPLPPPRTTDPFLRPAGAGGAAGQRGENEKSSDGSDILPPDLLARSRELEREFLGTEDEEADPEEAHYREVYEQFLSTRRECGEKTEGLTLEKFASRLRKNRDQLVDKYGCRTVRFQVYMKEGKAAIKASPVK